MFRKFSLLSLITVTALFFQLSLGASAWSAPLAAHRAVYDIKLEKASTGSGIASVDGRLVFELTGNACDGYALESRFVLEFGRESGQQLLLDLHQSSFETADSDRLDFISTSLINDKVDRFVRGTAKRTGDGIKVALRDTEGDNTHQGNILFPLAHLRKVINAARSGESFLSFPLFDGTEDGKRVYSTSVVIGKAKQGSAGISTKLAAVKPLESMRRWPVHIRYFNPDDRSLAAAQPFYGVKYNLFENGISGDFQMQYDDFSIRGTVNELAVLEQDSCTVSEE